MKLHENELSFQQAIELTAQELEIHPVFVEKDYWICQILQNQSRHPAAEKTVWKGGTSLSKAYGLIARFSSDVDFAILGDATWSKIMPTYKSELSLLSYRPIPNPEEIAASMKKLLGVVVEALR